ncbi:hypothetical protein EVAR_60091_1 [Eumeta japonica]|uniref:Reverse transcriptase domain-containing protein n=1 Tax=Eumeta variegata TaxID=151549 RepID=A0A4C1YI61_EUMVA|nr:hypothetical protein EVAR_60091_1 [Eumeta japonica]
MDETMKALKRMRVEKSARYDRVSSEMLKGGGGLVLYDLKEYERGLRMEELSVKCLLYADDQIILAPLACGLQEMENQMNDSVKKRGMK